MNILALDTATRTGWAVNVNGKRAGSGIWDFSPANGEHPGTRFNRYYVQLADQIRSYKIDLISYEAIVGGIKAGGKTSLIQKGLEAITLMCALRGDHVPVWSFSAATIKKWATGNGQLTHESKQLMVRTALAAFPDEELVPHRPTKSQPWAFDDNQCDALWLADLTHAVFKFQDENVGDALALDSDGVLPIAQYLTKQKWLSRVK